jgi:hypothetical protein
MGTVRRPADVVWPGAVAVQVVLLVQLTFVAGVLSNVNCVPPGLNPLPWMVTTVPPALGPALGVIEVMRGAGQGTAGAVLE